jgi:hypothetical protein
VDEESPPPFLKQTLDERRVAEIQYFFATYNKFGGKEFKVLGTGSPEQAKRLVRQGREIQRAGNGIRQRCLNSFRHNRPARPRRVAAQRGSIGSYPRLGSACGIRNGEMAVSHEIHFTGGEPLLELSALFAR